MSDRALHTPISRASLWFGFLGGAGAWTAHILLAYIIAEFACVAAVDQTVIAGIMLPAWWLIGMSALMLTITIGATLIARRARNRLYETDDVPKARGADIFMARTGYAMSGLFVVIIAVQSVPIFFFLQSC